MGRGAPDFLNNVEPVFPGFPNQGQQPSDRYAGSLAVRSTLSPTLINEARAAFREALRVSTREQAQQTL